MESHSLYLCYFSLLEPLVQTQVLPYLREIKKIPELKISLLTFEANFHQKWTREKIQFQQAELKSEGIEWYVLPYHKSPSVPATIYDVLAGAKLALRLIKTQKVNIIHARSHVAAAMGAIAKTLSKNKVKLIFDIRGFFPEEYTDAGNWKENGAIYKSVKKVEKKLLNVSDGFVVLTEKALNILFPESKKTGFDKYNRPVEVIPCCVNLEKFESANEFNRAELRKLLNLGNRYTIGYVGSLGTWYMAEEMADFFEIAKKQDNSVFAMILTQSPPNIMIEKLKRRGFTDDDFLVKAVPHTEIPKYLSCADVSISFIKSCYSKLSSSPTKIAEYLASGLPVITNSGVGDVGEQIERNNVGAVVEKFNSQDYSNAIKGINILRQSNYLELECKLTAKREFDLKSVGGERYRRLYLRLLKQFQ